MIKRIMLEDKVIKESKDWYAAVVEYDVFAYSSSSSNSGWCVFKAFSSKTANEVANFLNKKPYANSYNIFQLYKIEKSTAFIYNKSQFDNISKYEKLEVIEYGDVK